MKKTIKIFGFVLACVALVACTNNFCSNQDRANIMEAYVTSSVNYEEQEMSQHERIIKELKNNGSVIPSEQYWEYMEDRIYDYAIKDGSVNSNYFGDQMLSSYTVETLKTAKGKNFANEEVNFVGSTYYAGIKYMGHSSAESTDLWETSWFNFDSWNSELKNSIFQGQTEFTIGETKYELTVDDLPSQGFLNSYKSQIDAALAQTTACITPTTGIYAGIQLQGKSWGDAFNYGIIEGLIVYPIAWLLHSFYSMFQMGAWGAILSILIVTIIVRLFLLLVTFRSTMSQTRMQEMQPELQKIQAKYPNANTNDYQKNQMAQEQMALYKKYKVNPFSLIFVMIIQFPIFIAVWGAMSNSAILKVDSLFEGADHFALSLNSLMNNEIFSGNVTAIILFILMSIMQVLSVKLPTMLNRRDAKKGPNLGKNPAQDQSQKQMNMVSNIMMIMIIVMGFTLPVGMAIYWFIAAIISLVQSLVIRAISKKKLESKGYAKYKAKK